MMVPLRICSSSVTLRSKTMSAPVLVADSCVQAARFPDRPALGSIQAAYAAFLRSLTDYRKEIERCGGKVVAAIFYGKTVTMPPLLLIKAAVWGKHLIS